MELTGEGRDAARLLRGLEYGGMAADEGGRIANSIDPVLLWCVVRFLRECYPASDPAASPVLQRVVALTASTPGFVARCNEGEQDPIAEWFRSEYTFRDFKGRGDEMLALVVDKLES